MRELRLLRQDADTSTLVFDAAGGDEHFVLHVDDLIRAAVHFDVAHTKTRKAPAAAVAPTPVTAPSPVSPREIQVRVRAGEAPDAIAAEYGVEVERILRFAAPVVAERGRITDEARRARARGGLREGRPVVFGDFVDQRFATHGIGTKDVLWDARRRSDGEWVVVAEWDDEGAVRHAEWVFRRTTRTVTPANDTAAELLSDRNLRVSSTRSLTVAPALVSGVVPFPAMPEADTGPIPVVTDDVFDQEDVRDHPRVEDFAAERLPDPALPVASTADGADEFGTPPLPLSLSEPARTRTVTDRRRTNPRQTRTKVPSWDDIMLGVRPKSE